MLRFGKVDSKWRAKGQELFSTPFGFEGEEREGGWRMAGRVKGTEAGGG